jgi:hypothetical protein
MKDQSKLLSFYAKYQDQYVQMMRQLPLYGPSKPPDIKIDLTDFSKTNFGYSSVTAQQIADYLMGQLWDVPLTDIPSLSKTESFIIHNENGTDDSTGYRITADMTKKIVNSGVNVQYNLSLSFSLVDKDGNITETKTLQIGTAIVDKTLSGQPQQVAVLNNLFADATQYFENNTDVVISANVPPALPIIPMHAGFTVGDLVKVWSQQSALPTSGKQIFAAGLTGPTTYAWPDVLTKDPSDLSSDEQKTKDAAASFRGEVNAQMQLFLENARSMKDKLSDLTSRTNTLISQTKDAMQNQSQLLQSITESLEGLISAIFR